MKLLSPTEVKETTSRRDTDRKNRIQKMNDEETALVQKLNRKREEVANEYIKLAEDLDEKRNEVAGEIVELDNKISARRNELKDLLKPIDDQKAALVERENAVIKREEDVSAREQDVADREETQKDRIEVFIDREDACSDREESLDAREEKLKLAEDQHKQSEQSLAAKWLEYHAAVNTQNRSIELREKEVADQKKINDSVREENTKESARLTQERRAIQDGYRALEQAKEHIKKGNHGEH